MTNAMTSHYAEVIEQVVALAVIAHAHEGASRADNPGKDDLQSKLQAAILAVADVGVDIATEMFGMADGDETVEMLQTAGANYAQGDIITCDIPGGKTLKIQLSVEEA